MIFGLLSAGTNPLDSTVSPQIWRPADASNYSKGPVTLTDPS
jgi:hypothetical protein